MTLPALIFYIFATISVLFSLSVVLLKNPITSALSLVVSFFAVSGMFVLLHAAFVGVIQVLVYAGAIMVLFLYVTMLLNVEHSENSLLKSLPFRLMALLGGLGISAALFFLSFRKFPPSLRVDETFGTLESVGTRLLKPDALLFELVSVVLLVGIVGAIVLTQKDGPKDRNVAQ